MIMKSNMNECDIVSPNGGLTFGDVSGMGDIYFPGERGDKGSGDLPMPSGKVYKQIMPFDSFIRKRNPKPKKKKNKKGHFDKADEPCVHPDNPPIYKHVDDYRTYAERTKPHLCESMIPEDSMMDETNGMYNGKQFNTFNYFGDCRNTVDKDKMWDATQMSNWLKRIKIVNIKDVIGKLQDGDRKIPKKFFNIISKKEEEGKLDDLSEIVCGIDDYQKILAIYLSDTDIHYFFDCK